VGEGVKRGSKQYSEKYVERVCVFVQEGRKSESKKSVKQKNESLYV